MPDSLEMKTIRPQLRFFINGRYARLSRTPLITLTSKNRNHSGSEIWLERLWFENSKIIHQHIHVWKTSDHFIGAGCAAEIDGDPFKLRAGVVRTNPLDRGLHPVICATVHDDARTFTGETIRNRETDPSRRAGD